MHRCFIDFLVERGLISEAAGQHIAGARHHVPEPIGMIAAGHGLLRPDQIDMILDRQQGNRGRFGEIAVELGCLKREQVDTLLAIQKFRTAAVVAEALALAGLLAWEDALRYLGMFLVHDEETASLLAGE